MGLGKGYVQQLSTLPALAEGRHMASLVESSSQTDVSNVRTLVYLEGDATMRTYDDAEGKKQSSLSLVQTKIEVLKRPTPTEANNAEARAVGN